MKFKDAFVSGLHVTKMYVSPEIGEVNILEVTISYFMMQRNDNKKIICQTSLGGYREVDEDRIILLSDKDLVPKLESEIKNRFDKLYSLKKQTLNETLIEIDNLITKKSMYLQHINDLTQKEIINGSLSFTQQKSKNELHKAVRRVNKRLHSLGKAKDKLEKKVKHGEIGRDLSIQKMKRLIKQIKQ